MLILVIGSWRRWCDDALKPKGFYSKTWSNFNFVVGRKDIIYSGIKTPEDSEWLNNKVLLCSTRNYIQYHVVNHNGKETYIYIYIYIYMLCVCACACVCCAKLLQLCPFLYNPMDGTLPGSSVHEILRARILEWVAMPISPGIKPMTRISCIAGGFLTTSTPWEAHIICLYNMYTCI